MKRTEYNTIDGVCLPQKEINEERFETYYNPIRQIEKRIYTDKELALLPKTLPGNIHRPEWMIRDESSSRLIRYLSKQKQPLTILEAGCGNGWLSNRLSFIPHSEVTGLDINFCELQQAAKVFKGRPNLKFLYGNVCADVLKGSKFDRIVFAASLQYFASCREVINLSLKHLKENGEIHLLDTHFYKKREIDAARQRSIDYFSSSGFPFMSEFYFHHSLEELKTFRYQILYNPGNKLNRLFDRRSPFYWIRIKPI